MDTKLSSRGYSINLKNIPVHLLQSVKDARAELYVKPLENPNFEGNVKAYPVFRNSESKIYLPRYYSIQKFGPPKVTTFVFDELVINNPESTEYSEYLFSGKLRPVQEHTIEETIKAYKEHGGGLVSLDTGLGKTVVALKLISMLAKKTLIVVHAEFLLDQWVERIKTFLPNARIGIIKQAECVYSDVDVVVGMIQSITKRDYPSDCFKRFGHLIIDECHHIASRTFSSLFYKIQTKYMLGLSATPDRKDGLSKVIYWFLGPQIVDIKRTSDKPSVEFLYNDSSEYSEKLNRIGKVNGPVMITDLTKKDQRNELIIDKIKELVKESRKILVLSERREHCQYL